MVLHVTVVRHRPGRAARAAARLLILLDLRRRRWRTRRPHRERARHVRRASIRPARPIGLLLVHRRFLRLLLRRQLGGLGLRDHRLLDGPARDRLVFDVGVELGDEPRIVGGLLLGRLRGLDDLHRTRLRGWRRWRRRLILRLRRRHHGRRLRLLLLLHHLEQRLGIDRLHLLRGLRLEHRDRRDVLVIERLTRRQIDPHVGLRFHHAIIRVGVPRRETQRRARARREHRVSHAAHREIRLVDRIRGPLDEALAHDGHAKRVHRSQHGPVHDDRRGERDPHRGRRYPSPSASLDPQEVPGTPKYMDARATRQVHSAGGSSDSPPRLPRGFRILLRSARSTSGSSTRPARPV